MYSFKIVLFLIFSQLFNLTYASSNNDVLKELFIKESEKFNSLNLEILPIKDHGRLKPLDTHARESLLYIAGKNKLWGINPTSFYLELSIFKEVHNLKIINIRSPELREILHLEKKQTLFSIEEIEKSELSNLATEAFAQESKNKKLLTPIQNSEIEVMNQLGLLKAIINGNLIFQGLIYEDSEQNNFSQSAMQNLLTSASEESVDTNLLQKWSKELIVSTMNAKITKELKNQKENMYLEVFYNKIQFFFWAGILYFIIAVLSFLTYTKNSISNKTFSFITTIPLIMLAVGFSIRIIITEFPPVTNMYGTMIWVSFGISLFSFIFYLIYKDKNILGIMSLGAALLLLLTENIPLIIGPSMDPIVAVLRSSYWLTIHVLTITISYAAFAMAMILGNIIIIQYLFHFKKSVSFMELKKSSIDLYSHYAYRAIQLGVLLITAGIILGGVWADYSWGRFWGWDPKETWALIADLGFLLLLHGRFAGWITNFNLLILSPLAFLLVIMAWFGVNFVLSAGLHSYGFSSGGTFMVIASVSVQLILLILFYLKSLVMCTK